jgi:hypothetical protein
MNEATRVRIALAKKNATRFTSNPKVKAILLTGSVVQGGADDYSDVDCTIYYATPPSEEEYQAACDTAFAAGGDLYGGSAEEGFALYEYVDGIRCDFGYNLIPQVEELLTEMLTEPDLTDPNKQILVSGFVTGMPLYGEDWITGWQTKLVDYPPALAKATVQKHLRFHPYWVLEKMGVERNDVFFLYDTFVHIAENIFGILCGLNRIYHPGKLKGAGWTIDRMAHKPANLQARLEQIFLVEPRAALPIIHDLIEETLALVEAQMPEVDTSRTRRILPMVLRK